jgi:hypothetical protein
MLIRAKTSKDAFSVYSEYKRILKRFFIAVAMLQKTTLEMGFLSLQRGILFD